MEQVACCGRYVLSCKQLRHNRECFDHFTSLCHIVQYSTVQNSAVQYRTEQPRENHRLKRQTDRGIFWSTSLANPTPMTSSTSESMLWRFYICPPPSLGTLSDPALSRLKVLLGLRAPRPSQLVTLVPPATPFLLLRSVVLPGLFAPPPMVSVGEVGGTTDRSKREGVAGGTEQIN